MLACIQNTVSTFEETAEILYVQGSRLLFHLQLSLDPLFWLSEMLDELGALT